MENNRDILNNPLFEALPRRKLTPEHVHAHRRVNCRIKPNRLPIKAIKNSIKNRMESEKVDDYDVKVLRKMLKDNREECKRIKSFVKEHSSHKAVKKVGNEQITEFKYKRGKDKLEKKLIKKYLSKKRKKEEQDLERGQKRPCDDDTNELPRKKQKRQ